MMKYADHPLFLCLVMTQDEIYQCQNGHSIDGACLNKLQKTATDAKRQINCPTCQGSFFSGNKAKIRNRQAEEFIVKANLVVNCYHQRCIYKGIV